jgi:hypothetical protein
MVHFIVYFAFLKVQPVAPFSAARGGGGCHTCTPTEVGGTTTLTDFSPPPLSHVWVMLSNIFTPEKKGH